jgi:hypothetical protein
MALALRIVTNIGFLHTIIPQMQNIWKECTIKLVHEVCNGIFCPISFGFQFYLAQYITKSNKVQIPSAIRDEWIIKTWQL